MTAKVAIYTIGTWPGQCEKLEEQPVSVKALAGKYSGEERLLQHAKKKKITHLLVSDESALSRQTFKKLEKLGVKIMNFREVTRLL